MGLLITLEKLAVGNAAARGVTMIVLSGPFIRWYMYSACTPTVGEMLNVTPKSPFQPLSKLSAKSPWGNVQPKPKLTSTGLSCAPAGAAARRTPKTAASSFRISHTPGDDTRLTTASTDSHSARCPNRSNFGVSIEGANLQIGGWRSQAPMFTRRHWPVESDRFQAAGRRYPIFRS